MILTADNYYSLEADNAYWSASLIKEFLSCPARACAELLGQYKRQETVSLLVGSYVDAYFEGREAFLGFRGTHPQIFKKDGTLKSEYIKADEMIARAKSDAVFMSFMQGEKQRILAGEIGGLPFKCKLDNYAPGRYIVDLKTAKDFKPVYVPGQGKLTFADAWNWPLQMAIYQAIEGNRLPCYLAVITKETPCDIDIIEIPQDKLDAEMDFLLEKLPYFDAIKKGIIEPERCETCAYCRSSKVLTAPKSLEYFEEFGGTSIDE